MRRQRQRWSQEQDDALINLRETRSIKTWTQVAQIMSKEINSNKTAKQCRQRYLNSLKKQNKEPWSKEEEQRVVQLQQQSICNNWKNLSLGMKNRSTNCLKNRFYCILRRGLNKIDQIVPNRLKNLEVMYKKFTRSSINQAVVQTQERKVKFWNLKSEIASYGLANYVYCPEDMLRIRELISEINIFFGKKARKSSKSAQSSLQEHNDQQEIEEEPTRFINILEVSVKEESGKEEYPKESTRQQDNIQINPPSSLLLKQQLQPQYVIPQLTLQHNQGFVAEQMLIQNEHLSYERRSPNHHFWDPLNVQSHNSSLDNPISPPHFDQLQQTNSKWKWHKYYPH